MDLSQIKMFQMMKKRMDHSVQRQRVLSDNIANVNTPGYRPSDMRQLDFKDELRKTSGLTPMKTNGSHLSGASRPSRYRVDEEKRPPEMVISGNAVSVEDELGKVSETNSMYSLTTTLYEKQTNMLKTAIARPQ